MPQKSFYVPKQTSTYADALTAFGLADLLDHILLNVKGLDLSRSVEIVDTGARYEIRLNEPLQETWLEEIPFFRSPAPFLTGKKVPDAPAGTAARDVDTTWEQVRSYNEQRGILFDQGLRGTDIQKQLEDQEPPHDWQVVVFLGDWRMQAQGIYNRFVSGWAQGRPHFAEHLQTLLRLYASPVVDQEVMLKEWGKLAKTDGMKPQDTASQLLNPHQGKGLNEVKANALRMDNIKNRPWPEEILKAIGLWQCMAPRQASDTKDWKAYILAPRSVRLSALSDVYRKFNKYIWRERRGDATSLKTDITSILLFFRAWLDYIETISEEDDDDFDAPYANPKNIIHGFYVAQFKLLSQNAYTMVNQSFMGLPSWGDTIQTRGDVGAMKALIDEHLDVIRGVEESHSDGYDLLRLYRDFVAGENWEAFFDFAAGYAHEILARLNDDQTKFVPTFSTTHLRRLFMSNSKLTPILENSGFQSVADAIRQSTIVPQWKKAQKKHGKQPDIKLLYDIRYGLAAELKRKATQRDAFITALMDFVQSYNQETAQVYENTGKRQRSAVQAEDVTAISMLIDEYQNVELIANLLIAVGYAWNSDRKEDN